MRAAVHVGQLLQPVPGGIGRYVRHLVASLPGAGVGVHAFAAGPTPLDGVDYTDLGRPGGALRYELWHRLRRPAVRVPGDVVHATSLAVPPPGGRPLVVTVHDIVFLRAPEHLTARGVAFHRRGLDLARRERATIVVPSEYGRDDLAREGVDPATVHVAPHGVEAPVLGGRAPVDGPYLLFAATLEPRKGAGDLLEAHARLRRAHPDLQLVLAGPAGWGTPPATDRPGVVVTGNLGDADLDAAYRGALAMVLPSRYEGFGFQVVEAMARGCPVVTSDAACLPEIVGDAGVVVPTGDIDALTDALDELVRSGTRRAALADAGRRRAEGFTWERSAQAHARAYEAALAR